RARCAELDATFHLVRADLPADVTLDGSHFAMETRHWGRLRLFTPLVGQHQVRNAVLAVSALDLIGERYAVAGTALTEGVQRVHWPGRFEVRHSARTWIFDVAHNEAGVEALVETFRRFDLPRPVVTLIGILGDKDWPRMLPALFGLSDHVILTIPPTAPPNRAWDPDRVLHDLNSAGVVVEPDFRRALEHAQMLSAPAGTVLVTGSFHTVGDALAILGWSELEPDFPLQHNVFHG
ncbi:MAG: glutamate ligase domain-containing protein, partial [Longimicrobiales bacterium]